jgi:hypothetical protein
MFLEEPFKRKSVINDKNLDYAEYVKSTINDRMYMKLIRERLLKIRDIRNKAKSHKFISYPVGSMILVKDMRPRVHKKLKPIYFKTPYKIVTEYKNVIYAMDFMGRVKKFSKNNIRMAHPRTVELFGKLPEDIKVILGEEFSTKLWDDIKNSGNIPSYLADLEIEGEMGRQLRSMVPVAQDSNLINPTPDEIKDINTDPDLDILDDLMVDKGVDMINELHNNGMLDNENITLQDVPILLKRQNIALPEDSGNLLADMEDGIVNEPDLGENLNPDPAAIDQRNILPEGSRRTRRVRFNLPKLI